ncbi:MAG: hypothetical protein HQK79_21265 [Desulfobacterales bacterium]|nr:hypothetical protein [Desulfobacterales bacterium]
MIQKNKLSDNQLERIQVIHHTFLEVSNISLKQSIENFLKDKNPENEIQIWENIAKAYKDYCCSRMLTKTDKILVYKILLLRSMGSDNYVIEQVAKVGIAPILIREVLCCYIGVEKPITVLTS